jgi:hypothetical protein
MWNLVRTETNKQGNNNELHLNIKGKTVPDFHELANIFKDYFINATHSIQVENSDNTPPALANLNSARTNSFPRIHLTPVTANEIKNIIKSLKMKNSYGYDELLPRILKISLPYITPPLIYLCNKTMTSRIFPTWLKFSQVAPTFKKGDKD